MSDNFMKWVKINYERMFWMSKQIVTVYSCREIKVSKALCWSAAYKQKVLHIILSTRLITRERSLVWTCKYVE